MSIFDIPGGDTEPTAHQPILEPQAGWTPGDIERAVMAAGRTPTDGFRGETAAIIDIDRIRDGLHAIGDRVIRSTGIYFFGEKFWDTDNDKQE